MTGFRRAPLSLPGVFLAVGIGGCVGGQDARRAKAALKSLAAPEHVIDILETDSGYLFVDGLFIPAPYKVQVKGLAVLVNGRKTSEIVPVSPPTSEDEEEDRRYIASLPKAEREYEEKMEYATDLVFDRYFRWEDFFGEKEALRRLEKRLQEEKKRGKIPAYRIEKGSVMLFNQKGEEGEIYLHSDGVPLGPPYEQYDIDSFELTRKIAELAYEGGARYGPDGAKKIIGSFLASQKALGRYRFEGDAVVLTKRSGREKRVRLRFGTAEDKWRDYLEDVRQGVLLTAKSTAGSLKRGRLVMIDTRGAERTSSASQLKTIWEILSREDIGGAEKRRLLSKELFPVFAGGLMKHTKENVRLLHEVIAAGEISD